MPYEPRDFTRAPVPSRPPEPDRDDDDPFDWGPPREKPGERWRSRIVIFLVAAFFLGSRLGFGWVALGLALLPVWLGLRAAGDPVAAGRFKRLLTPAALLPLAAGYALFTFSWWSPYVLPESSAWPMPGEARALALPDGRRAATPMSVSRVQIYDADGRFQNGWFVPGGSGGLKILGPDQAAGAGTIVVDLPGINKLRTYDPSGRPLGERPRPENFEAERWGDFELLHFDTPWYLYPLVHPGYAWTVFSVILVLVGMRVSKPEAEARRGKPNPAETRGWFRWGCLGLIGMILLFVPPWLSPSDSLGQNEVLALLMTLAWALAGGLSFYRALTRPPAERPGPGRRALTAVSFVVGLGGAAAFILPLFLARSLVPAEREWPMPRRAFMLELPDDRLAGAQAVAHRVQIYDRSGGYLGGWYLPDNSVFVILGQGRELGPPEGQAAVEVLAAGGRRTVYDLQGRVLQRLEPGEKVPLVTGQFYEMSFDTPPYLWPLADPVWAWLMAGGGLLSLGAGRRRSRPPTPGAGGAGPEGFSA